ncbi:MAG: transposase [Prochloraceae cyanobacterium]|nr:transposase [Prochloraceae cyanobacterium]
MSVTRRITFSLYPNRIQSRQLHEWRRLHCLLYNAALANRKIQYQRFNHSVDYFEQQNCLPQFKKVWPEFKQLGSHALQSTLKRVDFAFQRFFTGLSKYPKFKAARYYRGWTYPCLAGWKALTDGKNGHLLLSNLGRIKMRGQARTWGQPTTCTIIWKSSTNQWFVSITVKCNPQRELGEGSVGIDFGTLTAAALSDGNKIDNPRFLKNASTKIKQISKHLKRKRRPEKRKVSASRRWKKTNKLIAKIHNQTANKRQDWCHQVATQITSDYSMVATERLNLKGMTAKAKKRSARSEVSSELGRTKQGNQRKRQKTGINRSILDVGIGMLRECISYKISEGGGVFVEVPTRKVKPSQTCPACGHQHKKDLSQREHNCHCGFRADRDVAAAMVMIDYARGKGLASSDCRETSSSTTPTYCGGMYQLGSLKRQKLPPSLRRGE